VSKRVRTHGTMIHKVRARPRGERDVCVRCVRVITRCGVGVTELNWLQHRRNNAGHRARKKASVMKRATAAENKCTRIGISLVHNHACGYVTTLAYVHVREFVRDLVQDLLPRDSRLPFAESRRKTQEKFFYKRSRRTGDKHSIWLLIILG